jgi:hypothetical protein
VNRLVCSIAAMLCCGWAAECAAQARPAPTRLSPLSAAPRTLVVPFDNLKREGRIFWLGEASAVLLTDDLNAVGTDAITRQERLQAFERLQVPPVAALTDATVIRIGQLVGAARVVVGSLQMDNDVLVVRARSITLDTGPDSIIGRAVIVHANPDDLRTQPAGNSGSRLACGLISKGKDRWF